MKRNLQALNQNNTKNLSASRRMSVGAANVRVVEQDNCNKMIDQFFIFGAPPDRSSNMCPTLLTMFPSTNYPQTDEDLAKITKLCFPNSFQPISENLSPNQVIINEFVFFIDQKRNSNFNHTNNSIECEVNRTYGIVVQFKAPADMTPFFSSNFSRKYPFALCILTHTHFLSSHFQFATFLALFLTGKIQSTQQHKQLRAPLPVRGFCHPSLTLDKKLQQLQFFLVLFHHFL